MLIMRSISGPRVTLKLENETNDAGKDPDHLKKWGAFPLRRAP